MLLFNSARSSALKKRVVILSSLAVTAMSPIACTSTQSGVEASPRFETHIPAKLEIYGALDNDLQEDPWVNRGENDVLSDNSSVFTSDPHSHNKMRIKKASKRGK